MKKLKRAVDAALLAYTVGRAAGVRLALGRWSDREDLPLAGRTRDPGGIWLRPPGSTRTLIVFRGHGSRSREAERLAPREEVEAILGEPTVYVETPVGDA